MGFGHEPGTKTKLDVSDAFLPGVLDVFTRDARTGIFVRQHRRHPKHFRNERHDAGLSIRDLNVRTQFFERIPRQANAVFFREIQDC